MGKKSGNLAKLGWANIILLSIVSLFNDISSEMIQPLLPLLITGLGGTGVLIGLTGGLIDGLPQILKIGVGYFSDKIRKRRIFIFSGYFVTQVSKLGIALSRLTPGIILFTSLDKVGKGIREPPRDALLSEALSRHKGKAFGFQRAFDRAGAILGSLAALLFVIFLSPTFERLDLLRMIMLIGAIIGFVSLIPILFLREQKDKITQKKQFLFASSMKHLSKPFLVFTAVSCIFALANFSYLIFILNASVIFGGDGKYILPLIPILLYVFYNVFYSVLSIPFGELSDIIGRKRVLAVGYFLFAIVCAGFVLFKTLPAFIVLFILYGVSSAMIFANQNAFVSDLSTKRLRATALGTFQAAIGVTAIISGVLAGYLFDINPSYTFIFGFATSLLALVIFVAFRKHMRKVQPTKLNAPFPIR